MKSRPSFLPRMQGQEKTQEGLQEGSELVLLPKDPEGSGRCDFKPVSYGRRSSEAPVWLMNLMGEDGDRRVPAGQWLQTAAIEKPCNELLMRLLEEEDAKCEWPWGNASSMAFLMPVPDLREVIVLKRDRNKMRQVRVWRTNAKIVYCM